VPAADRRSGAIPSRRALALAFSVVVHGALLYAVSLAPWSSTAPEPQHRLEVVWLSKLPVPDALPAAVAPPAVPDAIEPSSAPEPPSASEPPTVGPGPSAVADEIEPPDPAPAASEVPPAGSDDRPARRYLRPQIDFDEERRRAVAKVLEQHGREREYATFSVDDLAEEPPPELEPIVPPADVPRDNCVIAKGKLQQLVMMMALRCTRPPRDDMFAAIKPAYLNKHPLCREVRVTPPPRSPGVPENEIVATKCRLVDEDELLAAREDLDTVR
jgi:hypothetical protein